MPTYRIHHLTRYSYDDPVSVCHNLAHLLPRDSARHTWRYADMEISPAPAVRAERLDYFGNRLTFFAIQEPHHELNVTTRALVDLDTPSHPSLFASPSWESARDRIDHPRAPGEPLADDLLDALQFTFPSPYVHWHESPEHRAELEAFARLSFPPGRPLLDAALDLNARIHSSFRYDTTSTTISTTIPEILKARAGVCQDFAHLMIACFRSMGLAARYVSGYLLTTPPPGSPRLVGADASHAWASLFLPDIGWIDFDPTNNTTPSDKHITLAWGRDFGDVSPLRGVILGGSRHRIHVSVDVSPVS